MRRDLKPSLRQDTRRVKTLPTDIVKEVVINVVDDTVLHYEGSPLMHSDLVLDPENESLHNGISTISYQDEPWSAIGLATDNVREANNDAVSNPPTEPGQPPVGSPLDGSGGIDQPPLIDGIASGGSSSKYPTRSVILLDLTDIPRNAIIESAELELTAFPSNPPNGPAEDVFGSEGGVSTCLSSGA